MPDTPATRRASATIDLAHLRGQTGGDRDLEVELLSMFAEQARNIVRNLAATHDDASGRRHRADLLHLLCGSARAVGAWAVGSEAEALERLERDAAPVGPAPLAALTRCVVDACGTIEAMREHAETAEGAGSARR